MLKIAITGGIGSGKSIVCAYLEKKGYRVIYADRIARQMTMPGGSAIPYIIQHFGKEYITPDGSMDREKMRKLVMNDKKALHLLEQGTTLKVKEQIDKIISEATANGETIIFFEIPLLFEMHAEKKYDKVWLITADKDVRLRRVLDRDDITITEAESIIKNQIDDDLKKSLSDSIINNNGSIQDLRESIDNLLITLF